MNNEGCLCRQNLSWILAVAGALWVIIFMVVLMPLVHCYPKTCYAAEAVPVIGNLRTKIEIYRNDTGRLTGDLFRHAERDPEIRRLGCALRYAADDVLGRRQAGAHYYAVFPKHAENSRDTRFPVIVFLHGWLGNMSVYPLLLRGLADKTGAVVLIPSCGMGTWIYPDAPVLVSRVLADAACRFPLDMTHVVLGGISNGGRGVYQTMAVLPNRFVGVFYISAMLDPVYYGPDPSGCDHRAERANACCDGHAVPPIGRLDDPTLAKQWGEKRILIISGCRDVRVPSDYTDARVRLMRKTGLNVQWSVYEGDDHWLLFEEPGRTIEQISQWMANDVMPRERNRGRPK